MSRLTRGVLGLILVLAGVAGVWVLTRPKVAVHPPKFTTTAPIPAALAATQPQWVVVSSYVDFVRSFHPAFPATQPLGVPVGFDDAVHLVFPTPVYICSRGDLWLHHADAPPLERQWKQLLDEQVHVSSDRVGFVHWVQSHGAWRPWVVLIDPAEGRTVQMVNESEHFRLKFAEIPDWKQAISIGDTLIVPTTREAATWRPGQHEVATKLLGASPRLMRTGRGAIAWSETGTAAEWADAGWTDIGQNILQPLPLLDGSFLKIIQTDDGVKLEMESRIGAAVDDAQILALVEKLSDSNPSIRTKAFNDLQRQGPGAWPVLEKVLEDQPPEAAMRLGQLLKNKQSPTIAGLRLVSKALQMISRLGDGGSVLFAINGVYVTIPNDPSPKLVAPAWICLRPGAFVDLLPDALVRDVVPNKTRLIALADEWIVTDEVQGPRRFVGNALVPLVKKDERHFSDVVGIDRAGRWIFSDPKTRHTLIIDPTLPDPAPRLPVWLFAVRGGATGWDAADWPCMQAGGTWRLKETTWEPLEASAGPMQTQAVPVVPTAPGQAPRPLLVDIDGTRYEDGNQSLRVHHPGNKESLWPLPPEATGTSEARLFRLNDGNLLLINQPGRILRLAPTPGKKEAFEIQATFTRNLPDTDQARRVWLDPAGRLIIAYDANRLAICFPSGRIPQAIANMMPPEGD